MVAKCVPRACACSSSSQLRAFSHILPLLKHRISRPDNKAAAKQASVATTARDARAVRAYGIP